MLIISISFESYSYPENLFLNLSIYTLYSLILNSLSYVIFVGSMWVIPDLVEITSNSFSIYDYRDLNK